MIPTHHVIQLIAAVVDLLDDKGQPFILEAVLCIEMRQLVLLDHLKAVDGGCRL